MEGPNDQMFSIRVNKNLDDKLEYAAYIKRMSKAGVIREVLAKHFEDFEIPHSTKDGVTLTA